MSAAEAVSSESAFRNALTKQALIPYEKWSNTTLRGDVANAERILSEGWSRSKHPALSLTGTIPWDEFPPPSRSWNFHLNCWEPIDTLLSAHSSTGQERFLSTALHFVLDWISKHPTVEASQGQHAWYDMAVGMRAYRLAYALDAAARQAWVGDDKIASLRASLEIHRRELSDDSKIAFHSNHGFYQVAGQLAMARRFGAFSPEMRASLEQAKARLQTMLERQFTSEGVHTEHSPDYHRMVYDTLKGIVDAGLLDQPETVARLDEIERSLSWFVMPNAYLANFGDSDYRNCARGRRAAVDKWRTDEMRHAVTHGEVGAPPKAAFRAFEKSGFFVVRGSPEHANAVGASYLAQIAAFHSRTHKHADDLSFIWFDRGTPLLVDAGRYGYLGKSEQESELWKDGFWYSDPNRVYVESTRAHNTVEIDGRSHERKGRKPYGSALQRWGELADGVYYSECEVKHFKSIRHVRLLIYKPQSFLLVCDWLHDNVENEHEYRQWFHFSPELSVRRDRGQFVSALPQSETPLRVASLLPEPMPLDPVLGQRTPMLQGWWSPSDRVMLPSYAVSLEQRARNATFATVLTFCSELAVHETSRIAPSGRNGHLRWRADGERHVVTFARPEQGALLVSHEVGKARPTDE